MDVVIAPARIFAILLPTRMVAKSSDGLRIMKAMALPFDPPSSINWRARSTPIDNKAASAAEKNAAARKQIMSAKISDEETKGSSGGFMKKSWLS